MQVFFQLFLTYVCIVLSTAFIEREFQQNNYSHVMKVKYDLPNFPGQVRMHGGSIVDGQTAASKDVKCLMPNRW